MARTRIDPRHEAFGWVWIGLAAGLVLAFLVHQSCTTGAATPQDIGGTPRDVRCHALLPHLGWLYAVAVLLPPVATAAAVLARPTRLVGTATCVAAAVVVLGYVVYLTNADAATMLP